MTVDIEQVQKELVDVMNAYSSFDKSTKNYSTTLNPIQLTEFKTRFILWINSKLLADGIKEQEIKSNYKRLTRIFHPDRTLATFPELLWVEQQFSASYGDTCFVILTDCYNKLVHPEQFKKLDFDGINSIVDFRVWLEEEREHTTNTSYQNLCNQALNLLHESHLFFDETGTLNPVAVKKMVQFTPALITTYGISFVLDKLLIIYALYFVILQGGRQLERSNGRELQLTGSLMHQGTATVAKWNTALLCYFVGTVFSLSRLGFNLTTHFSMPFLLPSPVNELPGNELVSLRQKSEVSFNHPELKRIAVLFEDYLLLNNQQFFKSVRVGGEKNKVVKRFLHYVHDIDKTNDSVAIKLQYINSRLNILKLHTEIYTGNVAKTIECALRIIAQLQAGVALGLVDPHQEESMVALSVSG